MHKVEMTYQEHARAAQPPANAPKRPYRDIKHRWRCSRMKIRSVNVEIECVSAKIAQEGEKTYLGHAHTVQPPGYHSKSCWEVHRPRHQRGRIKFRPANISRTQEIRNAYLGCVNAMQTMWRPRKQIGTISKLTIKSRMLGEPWHDVEDHG